MALVWLKSSTAQEASPVFCQVDGFCDLTYLKYEAPSITLDGILNLVDLHTCVANIAGLRLVPGREASGKTAETAIVVTGTAEADDETLEMLRHLLKSCTPPSATSGQSAEGVRDERALVQVKKTAIEYHAMELYGSEQMSCMVMGVKLPAFMVSMSHIMPRHWWRGAGELLKQATGLTGCDDCRNIMFMLKCFEYTLDRMRWTPMYSEKGYLVHILDPSLRDVVIWDMMYSGAKQGASLVDRDKLVAAKSFLPDVFGKPFTSLKFGDFDKKPLTLMSTAIKAGNQPSKRCCNVHAMRSSHEAKKHSWIKNLSDVGLSPEAWSSPEALESQSKVLAWFGAKEEVDVKHQDQDDEDQGGDASWKDGDEDVSKDSNPFSALRAESSD